VEAHEYQTLFEFEGYYWWYRGLHQILLDTVLSFKLSADVPVLDAGCGTGQNLVNIARNVTSKAYGFDYSAHAAGFWTRRGLDGACVASINEIPFPDQFFQAVVSVDVLECQEVDEAKACTEMFRVLKPGGYLVVVVPAYDWLMNPEHHKAVGAVRRYTRGRIRTILEQQGLEVIRTTHLFGSVFPAVASYRLVDRFRSNSSDHIPRSDLKPLPAAANSILLRIVDLERRFLKHWDVPFGSSIMAVARKGEK
jgi:SAM-dependent methyltransferase